MKIKNPPISWKAFEYIQHIQKISTFLLQGFLNLFCMFNLLVHFNKSNQFEIHHKIKPTQYQSSLTEQTIVRVL